MTKRIGAEFINLGLNLKNEYKNPNEYRLMLDGLHTCESLFGDYKAKILLLMQDAADSNTLDKLKESGEKNPLKHSPQALTNKRLVDWFSRNNFDVNINGENSRDCDLYYANAVWLIKIGMNMRSPLRKKNAVLKECAPVLNATIENLINLRLIFTFGSVAYESISNKYSLKKTWKEAMSSDKLIKANGIFIAPMFHPAKPGLNLDENFKRLTSFLKEGDLIRVAD